MHDCSIAKSKLVDLIFDELDAPGRQRLLTEIDACDDCLSEYYSMTQTTLRFDQAVEASLPDESYWPQHHARLRQRLDAVALSIKTERAPFWKRMMTARLPVPVPVAAIIVIVLLFSTALALRPSGGTAIPTLSYSISVPSAPTKTVEVPVVQEKVITRTVYLEKRAQRNNEARRQAPSIEWHELSPTARNSSPKEEQQAGILTRASLTNYQPPDEMKIRIIRRSNSDGN